ncbi:putative galacturonan 1,4-alpha-galacturonidase [Dioscorea sansibarensis]
MKKLLSFFFLLSTILSLFIGNADAGGVFNVLSFGAKADGTTENSKAFLDTWKAACNATGYAKFVVPSGTYLLGPVRFTGPCRNVQTMAMQVQLRPTAPTTDGIHIERNSGVSITKSQIGTGDDCVSIGQSNSDVYLANIKCGPGHGIRCEKSRCEDCTLKGTDNGVRIKSWENSPSVSNVVNMTFDNIIMDELKIQSSLIKHTVLITSAILRRPSRVRISDVSFKNIRGTSMSPVAVLLDCSRGVPCQNVKMQDVHLNYVGGRAGVQTTSATCNNVKASYSGKQIPPTLSIDTP